MNHRMTNLRRRDFLRMALAGGAALAVPILGSRIGSLDSLVGSWVQPYQRSFNAIGTTITITIDDALPAPALDSAVASTAGEVSRLETLLTRFQGGTQVRLLNQSGSLETPSADVLTVLEAANRFSESSEGSFDITVKPVLDLLEAYASGGPFPTGAQFEAAKNLIDFESLDVSNNLVNMKPAMGVTVDGIAEGYIVDRAVAVLRSSGIRSALVNVGGTLAAIGGRATGNPWRVGIVNPVANNKLIGTLNLKDQTVATSGDYEDYFTADKSYYHVIDPASGRSPLFSHSATVVAKSAIEADPMGVALMVEGPSDGMKLLDGSECACLMYNRDGTIVTSSGFQELMT